ncbi:MAG: VWA domain-containing protein, partial [Thermoanaerobaculia bacterium]|nr:VWA domain-containing protein [Thermoanaerobaculia bacterium]
GEPLGGADRWVVQVALPLPVDAVEMIAVVSDVDRGRWGAARLEEGDGRLVRSAPGRIVEPFDLRPAKPDGAAEASSEATTTIVLLAPEGGRLAGRQRFRTLVTTPAVRRAEFYLDGELVESDDEAPFGARIDLGRPAARHTVEVRAYDAAGNPIGSDSIRLNEPFRSLDVSIVDLQVDPATSRLRLTTTVEHPTDLAVERVEYYHNEDLLGTATAPPWSFDGAAGAIGSTDYVRVVAYFDDGRFLEDVRLVSSPGTIEQVEVNLVQVYVVATDDDGEPVPDLDADDFRIRLRGEPQQIQRFAYADEVPLELALVIDTSPSMWPLMPDTRKAAARFLTQVVGEKDRALVVDFDTKPRVAHPLSGNLGDLLVSLGGLEAEKQGTTALYDSVIFSALELPAGQQRKAVVLLTDGDDYKSRFSLGRAIDTAKQAGVPVYVVSLAGIQDPRRRFRRTDLDALTGETGGEAYYLGYVDELGATYDKIARELRSQYLLAFPTTRQLSDDDLESIEVEVARRGLELRTVVGGRSVN